MKRHESRLLHIALIAMVLSVLLPLSADPALAQASTEPSTEAGSVTLDGDDDLVDDADDNCPTVSNTAQIDWDGDGTGDDCDPTPKGEEVDQDDDLVDDAADNCPAVSNTAQIDWDEDGTGDDCDATPKGPDLDRDDDLVDDSEDNCPTVANADQTDGDTGIGDACDGTRTGVDSDQVDLAEGASDDDAGDAVGEGALDSTPEADDEPVDLADMEEPVSVTPDNATVRAGDPISFTVSIWDSDVRGLESDASAMARLPGNPGLRWELDDFGEIFCDVGDGQLECERLPNVGTPLSFTVTSPTTTASCGKIALTVDAIIDVDLDGDGRKERYTYTDSGSITVVCPRLSIANTALGTDTISAGSDIGFAITVTNTDSIPVQDIGWSAQLPSVPGQTWTATEQDPSSPKCTITDDTTIACTGISLAPNGGSYTVHVTSPTTMSPDVCGTYSSTATLTTGGAKGSASASVMVLCPGILEIEVTPDNARSEAGDTVSFTLTVTNDSPRTITDVVKLTGALPTTTGLAWTLGAHDYSTCEITDATLECSLARLEVAEHRSVTVTSPTTSETCGRITTEATVRVGQRQAGSDTGSIIMTSAATCPNPVTISTSASAAQIEAGNDIGFVITVANSGAAAVHDIAWSVQLEPVPGQIWTITEEDPSAPRCTLTETLKLTCQGIDLAPQGGSYSVRATVPTVAHNLYHCKQYSLTATLISELFEGKDSAYVTVTCSEPTLNREAVDSHVSVGEPIAFTITATNASDGVIWGLTVRHPLPDGFAWKLASDIDGCAIIDGVIECTLHRLESGESIVIGITAPTSIEEHCDDPPNVVTLGLPENDDAATVTIHCDGARGIPADEAAPGDSDSEQVTQLPVTGTGTGIGHAGDAWWLLLSLLCLGCGALSHQVSRRSARA